MADKDKGGQRGQSGSGQGDGKSGGSGGKDGGSCLNGFRGNF